MSPRPPLLAALLVAALAAACGRPTAEESAATTTERIELTASAADAPAAARRQAAMDARGSAGKSGGGADGAIGGLAGAPPPPMPAPVAPPEASMARPAMAQSAAAPPGAPGALPNVTSAAAPDAGDAVVIRTGSAAMEVDSLELAIAAARVAVGRVGGWVANTSVQGGRDQVRSAMLELKVPAARFDALTNAIGTIGTLERLDVSAEDVTEEFVDVSARVENARRLEARLVELLARSTGRLSDVLAVERELARVREEIERWEGRLRYLRTRAATSTLSLSLHEPSPILAGAPGEHPIARAFRDAWRNFVGFVASLIASLGVLVPLGALAFVAYRIARPMLRRARDHRDAPPPADLPSRERAA